MLLSSDFEMTVTCERYYAGVSSPSHFSFIFISLTLTFNDSLHRPVYLYLTVLWNVSPCPSATLLLSWFYLLSLHSTLSPSSYWDRSSALTPFGLSALSSGIPYVSPLSSSSSSSSSVLVSPLPTVAVPLAPVSRGRQSAIGPLWSREPQRLQSDPWWLGDIFKGWC